MQAVAMKNDVDILYSPPVTFEKEADPEVQRPTTLSRPTAEQLERELIRLERREQIRKSLWNAGSIILVLAAAVVLVVTLWMPVYQVQRSSMAPSLRDGEIIAFIKTGNIEHGDVIAFHHGNQVLIKRVIAVGGDIINILEDGTVVLNGIPLSEPYVSEITAGEPDTRYPIQVEENMYFVLGDQRRTSLDSRTEAIGTIREDQIIGRSLLRVWPLNRFGSAG